MSGKKTYQHVELNYEFPAGDAAKLFCPHCGKQLFKTNGGTTGKFYGTGIQHPCPKCGTVINILAELKSR